MGQEFREDEPRKFVGGEERDVCSTCIPIADCECETCRRITGEVYKKKTKETRLMDGLLSSSINKSFWLLAPLLKWMC